MLRFVDLPTPLTPTMERTYGRPAAFAVWISRRRSREEVGVRILVSAFSIEVRRVLSIAMGLSAELDTQKQNHTCKAARLEADEVAFHAFA